MRYSFAVPVLLLAAAVLLVGAAGRGRAQAQAANTVRFQPSAYDNMYEMYNDQKKHNRPTLITSDSVLHTAHILFDYTLRAAELRQFDQQLRQLTDLGLMQALTDRNTLQHMLQRMDLAAPVAPFGYDRVIAYYAVGRQLLTPDAPSLDKQSAPLVEKEIALITAADTQAISPVMGVMEDYTQYKPRGHYTRNEAFQRFFRAMMWYGRAGFPISGESAPGVPLSREQARANGLAGIVLSRTLAEIAVTVEGKPVDGLALWNRIYQPTRYLVGESDDLTPPEYLALSKQIFGAELPLAWTDAMQAQTDHFIAAAIKLRPPQILVGLQSNQVKNPPVTLRLMGQRFVLDSAIFQQLVQPAVPNRFLPSGLDIMAVFGSPTALAALRQRGELTNADYGAKLGEQIAALQATLPKQSDMAYWQKSAYLLWLHTVRDLVTDTGKGRYFLPAWYNDPVWQSKQLNAGLGSWAELRHDTILYTKQSFTAMTAVRMPPPTQERLIYVEPCNTYREVGHMLHAMRQVLTEQGVFPAEMAPNYDRFAVLLDALDYIQETESPHTRALMRAPTPEQVEQTRNIGDILHEVETLPAPLRDQLTGREDSRMALIADVHTDPNHQQVLEVGVGRVYSVLVPMQQDGNAVLASGPIFSYYEFAQPMNARLTDGEWQQKLAAGQTPMPFLLGALLDRD